MLSAAENELLTRVGPGTQTGNLLRQYWIPVMPSPQLAEPDGPPLRVKLLGENLVLFRDTSGQVGLLAENCSHRGASLFFGRNEEYGLRCVYHGWKYDVQGKCVDMPNEPAFRWTESGGRGSEESSGLGAQAEGGQAGLATEGGTASNDPLMAAGPARFMDKIRHTAYPCQERNGVIWTYMGPRKEPPALPDLEWNMVPEHQRWVHVTQWECNWLQALETGIDPAHTFFLHSRMRAEGAAASGIGLYHPDRAPQLHLVETEAGVLCGARRNQDEGHYYWRFNLFLMPFYTMFPPAGGSAIPGHVWVPVDDTHTVMWSYSWNPHGPFSLRYSAAEPEFLPATSDPLTRWRPLGNASNDYLIDYEAQRTVRFSGIPQNKYQDAAMAESMGTIRDRTQEHLSTTDGLLLRARRRLLAAALALEQEGAPPPGADHPEGYRLRSGGVILPKDADWVSASRDGLAALTGAPVLSA